MVLPSNSLLHWLTLVL